MNLSVRTIPCALVGHATLIVVVVFLRSSAEGGNSGNVIAIAEGQVGLDLGNTDNIFGVAFEGVDAQLGDELILGTLGSGPSFDADGQPAGWTATRATIPGNASPQSLGDRGVTFGDTSIVQPRSAPWIADDDLLSVYSFAQSGTNVDTQAVVVALVPDSPNDITYAVLDNIPTFAFGDPAFQTTDVAADSAGVLTVAYTEFVNNAPGVQAQRLSSTGATLGEPIDVLFGAAAGVELLDSSGDRLLVTGSDFGTVRGAVIDTTGVTPQVLPAFDISTTPALGNASPAVAANSSTGEYLVAWEHITGNQGNPVDVRARRYDADGNPIGNDFVVNETTANAQGQVAVAFSPTGPSVIAWAGDATSNIPTNGLDIFAQVYDADGNPIGDEIAVNTTTVGAQSLPYFRFLPEPDAQGRAQFVIAWRDTEIDQFGGATDTPIGTGVGYRSFAIEVDEPVLPGDYNEDGVVNAADYVVWRDNEGAPAGTLPNDTVGGRIGIEQYNLWVSNFGAGLGSGTALAEMAVPEPATGWLVAAVLAAGLSLAGRRRR